MYKVLKSRGLPEQRPEVGTNGKRKSCKDLGNSFQVDRKANKWPRDGKAELYENWIEDEQKGGSR